MSLDSDLATLWDSIPVVNPPRESEQDRARRASGLVPLRFGTYGIVQHLVCCPQHPASRRLWGHMRCDCGQGCTPVVRRSWVARRLRPFAPLAAAMFKNPKWAAPGGPQSEVRP